VIWLRFRDNTAGEIDLESELYGPMFEPLRDSAMFGQFQIHPEFHTRQGRTAPTLRQSSCLGNVRVTARRASERASRRASERVQCRVQRCATDSGKRDLDRP
jgi:hypothetical protein